MIRLLLIFTLIFYVLNKFGFFRAISREARGNGNFNKPASGGKINVDASPAKEKKRSDFKGGEYVDYEDVK